MNNYIKYFKIQRSCILEKTSPNKGILLKDALIPRLLNNPFASCFLINIDFLLPHMAHFDNIIVLPILVTEILDQYSQYFFQHLKQ